MLQEISDEAIKRGVLPIEVFLEFMRYHYDRANTLLAEAETKTNGEQAELLQQAFVSMNESKGFAAEAAPLIHPRLSNVAVKAEHVGSVNIITEKMSDQEAIQAYSDMIKSSNPTKLIEAVAVEIANEDDASSD